MRIPPADQATAGEVLEESSGTVLASAARDPQAREVRRVKRMSLDVDICTMCDLEGLSECG
jgi:hypothetical protein